MNIVFKIHNIFQHGGRMALVLHFRGQGLNLKEFEGQAL